MKTRKPKLFALNVKAPLPNHFQNLKVVLMESQISAPFSKTPTERDDPCGRSAANSICKFGKHFNVLISY